MPIGDLITVPPLKFGRINFEKKIMHELLLLHPIAVYCLLGLFALAIGSLLNVFIYRLPIMLQTEWASQCKSFLDLPDEPTKQVNLFFPRSFCPYCKNMIHAWQNIPIISYCLLKGRCATCHHHISFQYPLVELLCFGLSLLAVWSFGLNPILIYALLFIWLLICLCFIDIQHQLLPDSLVLSLLWLGLIANTSSLFTTLPNAVLSAAGAYLGLWLFVKLFYLITGKIGMGDGDLKLFSAFGAWFGWTALPSILLISSITGAVVGIIYLKITKNTKDTPIPFGPFLCIAGLATLFCGKFITKWYLNY